MAKADEVRDLVDEGVLEVDDPGNDPVGRVKISKEDDSEEQEKPSLDQREEEIRQQEEDAKKEEDDATDTDVEDLDWDKLKEEHPEIEKLGIKDVAELIKRYFGGLPDFQKNAEIVKELKKLGVETPSEREELFKKLGAKEEIKVPEKTPGEEDKPKTFSEIRQQAFIKHVAESPKIYYAEDEEGERVPLSEDQKKATVEQLSQHAERILPSKLIDGLLAGVARSQQFEENYLWDKYVASCGDDAPSKEVRKEIQKHAEKYPHVYMSIYEEATAKEQNFWDSFHRYYIRNTKGDEIDAAQKLRAAEEREKEAKKKKDAKTETVTKAMPSGASKSWKDMTLQEKEQHIRDMEKAG